MVVPIVVRPWNRWGVTANKRAIPPVLMVRVNHLPVLLDRIVRIERRSKELDVRPCKMMNTLSYGNGATRSCLIPLHVSMLSRIFSLLKCLLLIG